ncbi:MAG TPA: hypothetical protein PLP17_16375, partial [Oligoflexia bacterium]|nr:hypothetical protein [Oligoflexia bacterium]
MLDYKLNKTFLRFLSTLFFVFVVFRPGPAHSQELELPATGVWNGFLNHDNVIECTNPASRSVAIRLVLRSNSGSIIDTHALPIPAFGTRHIQLNNYQIAGAYGTYLIEAAGGEEADLRQLYCLTMFYRFSSSSSTKPVEYAFAIPVNNPLRGETYGLFNSYNPILDQTPVFNWLSIYNPGAAPFSASVQVFRQDGTIDPAAGFYIAGLAPGERRDYPLGHPLGQVVGLYRIIADDPQAPYGAFLSRYSQRQNGSFNFAFAVAAANGSCRPGPITAS